MNINLSKRGFEIGISHILRFY